LRENITGGRQIKNKGILFSIALFFVLLISIFSISISVTASASTAQIAYITNWGNNTVSVIDTATNTPLKTIPVVEYPHGVAVTPDGTKVYVTSDIYNLFSVIDTATNNVTNSSFQSNGYGVAVNSNGTEVYLTDNRGAIDGIDTTRSPTDIVFQFAAGNFPKGVAVNPVKPILYVTCLTPSSDGLVTVFDTTTHNNIASVSVGDNPIGVAVTHDGTKVYVANYGKFPDYKGIVSVIDTATNNVTANVTVGKGPTGVTVTPDGTKVYVTNSASNTTSVIDTATNNVTYVPVGVNPIGVAVTPDGTKVYVANKGSNNISVIDTSTNNVTDVPGLNNPIAFGQFIGSVPQLTTPFANFSSNVTSGYVPLYVQFTDLSINATSWNWDFGDGANSTDQNPMHIYSAIGNYTVNLTVSNAKDTDSKNATITVLTPIQTIQQTITFVKGLVTSCELNSGPGNTLITTLNAAKVDLNGGNTLASTIELKAFISQVQTYINIGIISPTNGQTLIKEANGTINAIPKLSTDILEMKHTKQQKTRTTRLLSREHTCYSNVTNTAGSNTATKAIKIT
jgi:YVTN family beta-propeller protein